MKKLIRKVSLLLCTLALAFPVSASAATVETLNGDKNFVKLSERQLRNENGVTLKLSENNPVTVEFPDGNIETFTYKLQDVSGEKASRATYKASVERGIRTASLELWGYATWEGRTVSFDDEAYLDFWGLGTSVEEGDTWITNRSATNSGYAKARTRGICTTTELVTGADYSSSYDFEMWLDPISSSDVYCHINQ